MAFIRRGFFLIIPILCGACIFSSGSRLPETMPGDFKLVYTMKEMTSPDDEGSESAEPNPDSEGPPLTDEESMGPEPSSVFVEIDHLGTVSYKIDFREPRPATNTGSLVLETDELEKVYDIVRKARILEMEKNRRYIGEQWQLGRRNFYVRGENEFRSIDVVAMRVDNLDTMWADVREILLKKAETLLDFPKGVFSRFVLDKRTLLFHTSSCERVKEIPEAMRMTLPTWQRCLDLDGEPCPECHPMEQR